MPLNASEIRLAGTGQRGGAWVAYRPPRGSVDTWHAVTFQNGWTNYGSGYSTGAYTITEDGWVRLRGLVRSGTIGNAAIFTLPVDYRPPGHHLFGVITGGETLGRVDVLPDGQVLALAGSNGWVSLFNVTFATY